MSVFFGSWHSVFEASALPGTRIAAGMAYSLAEALSCLASGIILRHLNDQAAFTLFSTMSIFGMCSLYFFCHGNSGSYFGLLSFFSQVFGIGSNYNTQFLMIERRVPPKRLGKSYTVIGGISLIFASTSSFLAYAQQPWPFASGVVVSLLGLFFACMLPKPKQTLQLQEEEYLNLTDHTHAYERSFMK